MLHNIEVKEEKEYIKQYITVHLKYIAEAADIQDEEKFKEIIRRGLTSIDEESIMTLAEKWKKEGIQQGLQQGLEQGLEKGLEKGRLEIARSMLQKGLDSKMIMEITSLSEAEISKLLN